MYSSARFENCASFGPAAVEAAPTLSKAEAVSARERKIVFVIGFTVPMPGREASRNARLNIRLARCKTKIVLLINLTAYQNWRLDDNGCCVLRRRPFCIRSWLKAQKPG